MHRFKSYGTCSSTSSTSVSDPEKEVMRRIIEEHKDFSEEDEEEEQEKESVEKRRHGPKKKPLPDEVMQKLQGTNHF